MILSLVDQQFAPRIPDKDPLEACLHAQAGAPAGSETGILVSQGENGILLQ